MSNRLHIDTVQVHLLRQVATERKDLYLDGEYIDAPEVAQVLWAMNREDGCGIGRGLAVANLLFGRS